MLENTTPPPGQGRGCRPISVEGGKISKNERGKRVKYDGDGRRSVGDGRRSVGDGRRSVGDGRRSVG
jgi:hypothetical protein